MTDRFFIFGAGYSGKAFGALASSRGAAVAGTTRSGDRFAALRTTGIEPLLFDGLQLSPEAAAALVGTTHLIVSAAPDTAGDPVLRVAGETIRKAMPALVWIGYLSTVGVYGDHQGGWIDETTPTKPVSDRSGSRVHAENEWTAIGAEIGVPVAALRLSGIYGPGRNAFVNLKNGTARRLIKPGQVFNRIHVDDIAGALRHLAAGKADGAFNVTDDEPAPPQDVVTYAAAVMGVEPPEEIPFETAQLSPMARSFYGENKRVSNARLKAAGYTFHYPDYRSAFDAMWAAGDWAGEGAADRRSPIEMAERMKR